MGDINLRTADIGQIMNQTVGIVIASYLTNKQKDNLIEKLRIIQGLALETLKNNMEDKKILDVCCGNKMFWFDKNEQRTIFMDIRKIEDVLCDNRELHINPDIIGDFRNIPFKDNEFNLVVFDPPHLIKVGEKSWLAKKYGKLDDTWSNDIKQGFDECMRVLKKDGVLIFKWNEEQIKLSEILQHIKYVPLFGNKRSKTHWLVFMK